MPPPSEPTPPANVTPRRVLRLWSPLAGSWLLMGIEMPMLTIAMTRMAGGEPHLAALGALVYPLSILIEAPIIMLLAASTALVQDRWTHARLLRFTHLSGLLLTLVHVLVSFTSVYDWIAVDVLAVPMPTVEPGRIGLQIMTPWTWSIAYRRYQQGVLIGLERSDLVAKGTLIRLGSNVAVLTIGLLVGSWPGIVVGATGVACGVIAEALWACYCFRSAARERLPEHPASTPLTWGRFARFYWPLACTPLITIVIQPIGSWAMSQMSDPVASLAAWPAAYGVVFLLRSVGFAYNEVVVRLAGEPGGRAVLRRCGYWIAAVTSLLLILVAATPISELWFHRISGLSLELSELAGSALFAALLMPAYAVAQNYLQGLLVHQKRTRAITEAVLLYLAACIGALLLGMRMFPATPGIYITLAAFTVAGIVQTAWLYLRARPDAETPRGRVAPPTDLATTDA
ncbi:MAG: hypothetical protein AB8H80_07375 [Planctomycetota bacterium]